MNAYNDLMAFQRQTEALSQVAGRLGWDQETIMPRGAVNQRAEEMGAMEAVLHARRTDARVGDWLAALEGAELSVEAAASLRHIRRSYDRATKVPGELAEELARVTSRAQGIWAEARSNEDVAHFLPILTQVVSLRREEAAAIADGGDLYDALLDGYEPDATASQIGAMFDRMRPRLVLLRERIMGCERSPKGLTGTFDAEKQLALSNHIAGIFGYDFDHGRIDKAVHPFSSGSGQDVRITTRVDESDPFNCLYSTIHEVGHACYEQRIDDAYLLTPLGAGVSMGVHESQSRIYENQLGRGRAFAGYLFNQIQERFGHAGIGDADAFYAAVNRVHSGFIRTEADEVHYNLHIMMRFDLERALIGGQLEVFDLEEAWNTRFAKDFGAQVDKPSNGVLQDVHWSVGLFGYFPTYTLGNVYAGCLYKALQGDLPDLDSSLAAGNPRPATDWLRAKLQRFGGLYTPGDLIAQACGFNADEGPLLDYLDAKFSELYNL